MEIRFALPSETAPVRDIWKCCFGDTDSFLDAFFQNMYAPTRTLVCIDGGRPVGSLQFHPRTLLLEGKPIESVYIGGVGVLPACRGRGIASEMLKTAHKISKEQNLHFPFLAPAPGRFSFYRQLGYKALTSLSDYTGKVESLLPFANTKALPHPVSAPPLSAYESFISGRPLALMRTADSLARSLSLFENAKVVSLESDAGYILYAEHEDEFFAYECAYRDEEALCRLLGFIAQSSCKTFRIRAASDAVLRRLLFDNAIMETRYPHIMVQTEGGHPSFSSDSYINMLGWF